jgi:putative transposase
VAMDEAHLMAAVRYVALNPMRARLAARAEDWPWSSVRAHLAGKDDGLVTVAPVLARIARFADLIVDAAEPAAFAALRAAE